MKPEEWPEESVIEVTGETEDEVKPNVPEVFKFATQEEGDSFDNILGKCAYWKTMRIMAWMARFLHNLKSSQEEPQRGPLTTEEIQCQVNWWIKREQHRYNDSE